MRDTLISLLLLFLGGTACAQNAAPPPPDRDPLVGVWMMNKQKSPRIRSSEGGYVFVESYYSETIAREGDDIVVIAERGPTEWCCLPSFGETKMTKTTDKFRCDGNLNRLSWGSISCNYVAANITEGRVISKRNDVIFPRRSTYFWTTEISPNCKERKDSFYKEAAMKKLVYFMAFDRVK